MDLVDLVEAPLRLRFETDIVPRYLDFKYHADRLDRMILDEMAAGRR